MPTEEKICLVDLGLMPYEEALEAQLFYHEKVKKGQLDGALLIVQHPPVLTVGRNSGMSSLRVQEGVLKARGVSLYTTSRGGDMTAHNPGQMVVYPIIKQQAGLLTPKKYVFSLEKAVIDYLSTIGIEAARSRLNPGVWVGNAKICAIGVRIKDRVSMHGLAFNIDNDLGIFDLIVPCGIVAAGVCRVRDFNPDLVYTAVRDGLLKTLANEFMWHLMDDTQSELPMRS